MPALPARITHHEAPAVVQSLSKALLADSSDKTAAPAAPWPLDAAALTHFDSSALAVLLECRRLAETQGRKVQISNAPVKLGQLARLYGIEDLLDVAETAETTAVQV